MTKVLLVDEGGLFRHAMFLSRTPAHPEDSPYLDGTQGARKRAGLRRNQRGAETALPRRRFRWNAAPVERARNDKAEK